MSEYPKIAERFVAETRGHEMTVLFEQGCTATCGSRRLMAAATASTCTRRRTG